MSNYRYVEPVIECGFLTEGYSAWDCDKCGEEVCRYSGQSDVDCHCGASYNASGQRLRDNWRANPSNYDDEIGDMEGYEIACLQSEMEY